MIEEVFIGPLGVAIIICPECRLKIHARPGKAFQHKILDHVCQCGFKYQIIFDNRFAHRKKCSIPGVFLTEKDIPVVIKDISRIGASFAGDVNGLEIGSYYKLKMKIDTDWIESLAKITRVGHKLVGVTFHGLASDHKNKIESYVLSV
jgi:hypothetical protein